MEKLKEFASVSYTSQDIIGDSYPLFETAPTSQAVLKTIEVMEAPTGAEVFTGNRKLNDVVSGSTYSFIDSNKSVVCKLVPAPTGAVEVHNIIVGGMSNSNLVSRTVDSTLVADYPLTASATSRLLLGASNAATSAPVTYMNNPCWFYKGVQGAAYFYYDGNSTTQLSYARVSNGVVGSWASRWTTSYDYAALDFEHGKAYAVTDNGTYQVLDIETGDLLAGTGGTWGNTTSYARAGFCHELLCSQYDNGTSSLYWKNVETGATGDFPMVASSSNGSLAVVYNPDENNYYIIYKANATVKIYQVDASTMSSNGIVYEQGDFRYTPNNGYGAPIGDSKGNLYYFDTSGYLCVVHLSTSGLKAVNRYTDTYTSSTSFGITIAQSKTVIASTVATDYNIPLEIRLAGIEITE